MTVQQILDHMNESGIYNESDLEPFHQRIAELRCVRPFHSPILHTSCPPCFGCFVVVIVAGSSRWHETLTRWWFTGRENVHVFVRPRWGKQQVSS